MIRRTGRSARLLALLTAVVAGAGLVVACSEESVPTIDYLVDARIDTYNANTVDGNAAGVLMATTRVLPGFTYLGAHGQTTPDHDIGTVTAIAGPRQVLRYEFHPDAAFSDGEALDCDDILLTWAAMNGRFPSFEAATHGGYKDITGVECSAGDKAATVTYAPDRAYRDWASLFGAGSMLPAHVVAKEAGVDDVIGPIRSGDDAAIKRIAQAWNTAFGLEPGDVDAQRFPASGPYRLERVEEDGVVLVENEAWWGDAPSTPRIRIRDRATEASVVADGDFDIADAGAGFVEASLEPAAAEVAGPDLRTAARRSLGVSELVLAQRGVFADLRVRRAFSACVPRDGLTRDHGLGAQMWNLRTLAPADNLAEQLNNEFGNRYPRADAGRARALLAEAADAGVAGIGGTENDRATVRIGYLAPDARAAAMVESIAASCRRAGLTVTDVGSPDLRPRALGADADVLLATDGNSFAAAGAADPARDAFGLHGRDPLNLGGFAVPAVTQAIDAMVVTASIEDRLRRLRLVENTAWAEVASIPLFAAAPRVHRWDATVDNVAAGYGRNGTGWNMDRWQLPR